MRITYIYNYYTYTKYLQILPRAIKYKNAFLFIIQNISIIVNETNKFMISRYVSSILAL